MRVPSVSDSRREVAAARRASHARHVEIGLLRVAPEIGQHGLDVPLGLRVMDERGLEAAENLRVSGDVELVLCFSGVEGRERLFDESARECAKGERARLRRKNEDLTL